MVIQQLKAWGVNPYVISAMGSHGGLAVSINFFKLKNERKKFGEKSSFRSKRPK
jgi:hypothetical protein